MHSKRPAPRQGSVIPVDTTRASRLDWDDLRYVLAVARAGSLSGSARVLAVTHSTMLRRIDAIEAKLQVRLFERSRNGYAPTDAGETLRAVAEQCEPLVAEAERRIVGGDTRLIGTVRLTTAHVLAQFLMPREIAKFHTVHPDIEVEMLTSRERIDLARREADVALRLSAQVPDYLVGRKLGDIRIRVYGWHGSPFMPKRTRKPKLLPIDMLVHEFPWIGFERYAQDRIYDRWLNANVPPSSVIARVDHFPSAFALLHTGIGVALLPEFVAQHSTELVELSAPIDALQTPLWILTHPDLRNTARVRAFMQTVGNSVEQSLNQK